MKKHNRFLAAFVAFAMLPTPLFAQSGATGVGGLRAYVHVFIAYTIAIALILGWVISIGRRLRDVEQRLGE